MTETKTRNPIEVLALTLVELDEICPNREYVEQLKNTARKLRECDCESDLYDKDVDELYKELTDSDEREEPSYYDIEETITKIFEMCDTIINPKEIMAHMRVARELRFVWYPFPGEISR